MPQPGPPVWSLWLSVPLVAHLELELQAPARMQSEHTKAVQRLLGTNSNFFASRISSLVSLPWLTFLPDRFFEMGFIQNSKNPKQADSDAKQAHNEARAY
jgi:hypothetical protein